MDEYLYCGICYKSIRDTAVYLTSCAHVVCEEHVQRDTCSKCKSKGVSIIKIESDLSNVEDNIRDIIEPSYEKLSNLQFGNKFQYEQMKSLIEHYRQEARHLREKNVRLKDLLRKSRVELDKCSGYQKEIEDLRRELRMKSGGGKGEEFVSKLKKFGMKSRENSIPRGSRDNNSKGNKNNNKSMGSFSSLGTMDSGNSSGLSIQAESTNISRSGVGSKMGSGMRGMSSMSRVGSLSTGSSVSSRLKSRPMLFKPPISKR